jgi:hypothetical protein
MLLAMLFGGLGTVARAQDYGDPAGHPIMAAFDLRAYAVNGELDQLCPQTDLRSVIWDQLQLQ